MTGLAIEVSFPLDRAIILPGSIFELDPNPLLRREVGEAREADNACALIIELDDLAGCDGGKVNHNRSVQSIEMMVALALALHRLRGGAVLPCEVNVL